MRGKCNTCRYKCSKCNDMARARQPEPLPADASLCWCCKNAVPEKDDKGNYTAGCAWSMHKKPVEGWEVCKVADVYEGGKRYRTYCVRSCPQFERG